MTVRRTRAESKTTQRSLPDTMNRRTALQALLALGAVPRTGFGRAAAHEPNLIRIDIPGPRLLPFIPVELIPKLGFDRELGVELAIRHMPSGVQTLGNVIAGDAHFAGTGFMAVSNFAAKGTPVVALAALSSGAAPYAVLIRNELAGQVRSVKDLKGRSVGTPLGSATSKTHLHVLMELWLQAYGVAPDEVRWVPVGINLDGMHGALASGSVDAVLCEEPLAGTLVRKGIGTLLANLSDPRNPARIVGRDHVRTVIASTPEIVAANPQRVEQMLRMLRRTLAWMHKQAPEAVVERLGFADAEETRDVAGALRRLPGLFSRDGRFGAHEIAATVEFLKAAVPVAPGFDIRALIDDRWLHGGR